eukprot:760769-Prorocentrum_minimum.AAC.1
MRLVFFAFGRVLRRAWRLRLIVTSPLHPSIEPALIRPNGLFGNARQLERVVVPDDGDRKGRAGPLVQPGIRRQAPTKEEHLAATREGAG